MTAPSLPPVEPLKLPLEDCALGAGHTGPCAPKEPSSPQAELVALVEDYRLAVVKNARNLQLADEDAARAALLSWGAKLTAKLEAANRHIAFLDNSRDATIDAAASRIQRLEEALRRVTRTWTDRTASLAKFDATIGEAAALLSPPPETASTAARWCSECERNHTAANDCQRVRTPATHGDKDLFSATEARAHFLERVARFIEGSEPMLFEVPSIVASGLRVIAAGKDAASRTGGGGDRGSSAGVSSTGTVAVPGDGSETATPIDQLTDADVERALVEFFPKDHGGFATFPPAQKENLRRDMRRVLEQFPFGDGWKHNPDPVRNLAKAGAMIAAEIDRIQRRAMTTGRGDKNA